MTTESAQDPKLPNFQVYKFRKGDQLSNTRTPRQLDVQPANLLDEAFRFFNFADQSAVVIKRNWPKIEFNTNDLTLLRYLLHDAVINLFDGLSKKDKMGVSNLEKLAGADVVKQMSLETYSKPSLSIHTQDFGRLAVRFLIADSWRPAAASTKIKVSGEKQQKGLEQYKRYFDQLDTRLLENRALLSHDNIQKELKKAYSSYFPLLTDPNRGKTLMLGWFPASNAPSGVIPNPGLTEKLYAEITHRVFPENPSKKEKPLLSENPFQLPNLIKSSCRRILEEVVPPFGEIPFSGTKIQAFSRWDNIFKALDQIEALFEYPLLSNNSSNLAIQAGLPWALILTSVLRVYVTDVIGTIFKLSVPIKAVHGQLNGFAGVALWEALTGKNIASFDIDGYLAGTLPDFHETSLLKKINTWTIQDFNTFWHRSKQHEPVKKNLIEMRDRSILDIDEKIFETTNAQQKKSGRILKPELDFTLPFQPVEDALNTIPVYPQIFIPNLTVDDARIKLILGAMPVAQAHFYVFKFVIDVALNDLKYQYKQIFKEDKSMVSAQTLVRPKNSGKIQDDFAALNLPKGLRLAAGSMLFGGHHPPHKTHKDGDTYDCNFPPNTLPWFFDQKIFKEMVLNLVKDGILKHPNQEIIKEYSELYGIVNTDEEYEKKGLDIIVFKVMIKTLIQETLNGIVDSVSLGTKTEDRAMQYIIAEKKLYGTPHFLTKFGTQQRQIGHIAAILSAPQQIIFSSPITHLRSMFAIEKGLLLDPQDKTELVTIAPMIKKIVKLKRGFVFLPNDHNDHWHIEYGEGKSLPIGGHTAMTHFESFYELWHYLGINFDPFITDLTAFLDNLRKTKKKEIPKDYVFRIEKESSDLINSLKEYQKKYKEQNERNNRIRLHDILMQMSDEPDNSLLLPAKGNKPSSELRKLIKESLDYLERILPQTERERLKSEKPGYKEFLERYEYFNKHNSDYDEDENGDSLIQ
ncbi:MAG: hypothetical protein WBB02_12685 [Saprospiraceae bacterium]